LTAFFGTALFVAAVATQAPLDAAPQARIDDSLRCHFGVYGLPDGEALTITGSNGERQKLHYVLSSGRFGSLQASDKGKFVGEAMAVTFAPCAKGSLILEHKDSKQEARKLKLIERAADFESDGIKLRGKLVLPVGGRATTAAVWIEGSNNNSSVDDSVWQYELARRGIATFVYDKRGTGGSAGAMTSDFALRARDTATAVAEVRRLAPRIRRVGVIGASQGGWVAPLVAQSTKVDFMIAAFAMAESPIAQDQALVRQQIAAAGLGDDALAKANALTAITERIVRTNMQEGLPELDAFKAQHAGAAWLAAIAPRSYTGLFLQFPSEVIRVNGPALAQGLGFDFEPRPIIENIAPRQLWLLGGSDSQAPSAGTQAILRDVQQKRRDVSVVVFPRADHGLIEPMSEGRGMTFSPRLFDVAADWIQSAKLPGKGRFVTMSGAER
jgi:uncharacterized protein